MIAKSPLVSDAPGDKQKGPAMTDQGELAGFPRFSEFYQTPVDYNPNFVKMVRGMEQTQRESLKQAIRRLAKRGYQNTRAQQNHKKFEGGSKDLPVPAGATASKACQTIRYFWSLTHHQSLHVYYVGRRGDVYRSER